MLHARTGQAFLSDTDAKPHLPQHHLAVRPSTSSCGSCCTHRSSHVENHPAVCVHECVASGVYAGGGCVGKGGKG